MHGARAGRSLSPAPAGHLDPDLAAAFRARAARDRRRLLECARALAAPVDWKDAVVQVADMEMLAHGLAGASAIFDHPALGDLALRLERLLARWRAEQPAQISRRRLTAFRGRLDPLVAALAVAADRRVRAALR